MSKLFFDAVMEEVVKKIEGLEVDLLSVEYGKKRNKDGDEEPYTRVEVEIPRGNGVLSRCRYKCKLPATKIDASDEELENGISAILIGLQVTYVSSNKEIYMKAEEIHIIKE